jgi:hypothetical protein
VIEHTRRRQTPAEKAAVQELCEELWHANGLAVEEYSSDSELPQA